MCFIHLKRVEYKKGRHMSINYKRIGLKIKEFRLQMNLTQEELAEMCNLSTIHISNIERGRTCLSLFTLNKLSHILNFNFNINIFDNKDNSINEILQNCCQWEYEILKDILIATKNSIDINLNFKS